MSVGAGPGLSSFPYGFANGVSIRGVPLAQTHPGRAVWLYNGTQVAPGARAGADGNGGGFNSPCSTLAGSLLKCMPGRGDMIFVKPGHVERISTATALIMSVAGVAVIGLGSGQLRPKFILDTVVGATVNIASDDITFSNCQFVANFANITSAFTLTAASFTGVIATNGTLTASAVTGTIYPGQQILGVGVASGVTIVNQLSGTVGGAGVYAVSSTTAVASVAMTTSSKGFNLDGCDVADTSSILNFLAVVTTSTTSNVHDQLNISRNRIVLLATSGACPLLSALGTQDRVSIADNYFQSATTGTGAIIPIAAGKVLTGFLLLRNILNTVNAAATATGIWITTNGSTNTGFIDGNAGHSLANTTLTSSLLVTASSGIFFGINRYARAADKTAVTTLPAIDT